MKLRCVDAVAARLRDSGLAARKEVIALRVGFKKSTVAKSLTVLRKDKKVGLSRGRYWAWL